MSFNTNSGAPSINVPSPSNVTADSLRCDENGSADTGPAALVIILFQCPRSAVTPSGTMER